MAIKTGTTTQPNFPKGDIISKQSSDPDILFGKKSTETISHVFETGLDIVVLEAFSLTNTIINVERVGGEGSGEWFNQYCVLTASAPLVKLDVPGRWRLVAIIGTDNPLGSFFAHVVRG